MLPKLSNLVYVDVFSQYRCTLSLLSLTYLYCASHFAEKLCDRSNRPHYRSFPSVRPSVCPVRLLSGFYPYTWWAQATPSENRGKFC